jgi:hypothetical protein
MFGPSSSRLRIMCQFMLQLARGRKMLLGIHGNENDDPNGWIDMAHRILADAVGGRKRRSATAAG